WLSILAAIVLTITLIFVVGKIRITRENRLTNIPGKEKPISCTRIRTVTLYNHSEAVLEKGESFVAPLLERNGYTFGGWFYDTAFTEPYKTTKITEDITLYPKWTKES
ncbi:MAG: InlB B-repeat-containing protein, partial [Clostridia bacterium]|nr:InlB B-repeat-containing protein [Clostridia bacterium]